MMNTQLNLVSMIERAEFYFPKKEVVSRTHTGIYRFTYREIAKRTRALSSALAELGVGRGDHVASLAWNHHRHLETYFAVPCMGAVLHTANFRLSSEHLAYILNHAEDKVLLLDDDIIPVIENIQDQLKNVKAYIIMTDKTELPETTLSPAYNYEDLVASGDLNYSFALDIDENEPAAMCYTSATTGKPKGVIYTHRGITLHSMAIGLADSHGVSESDINMPVVPMFHVNAWGMPFASTWFGSTQVLPGPHFTPQVLAELIESEKVTTMIGVPTVWLGLLNELEQHDHDISSLSRAVCGGSAAPRGLIRAFESDYGIPFINGYGLTESTPAVTVPRIKSYQRDWSEEQKLDIRSRQGMAIPGVDVKVVNDDDQPVKPDGEKMGELILRGPWIADHYYKDDRGKEAFKNGWFYTGDIATIDNEGDIKLVDRTKDLVKSGGEWISSVDLENALMTHNDVFEAAVVAVSHPKWDERPVACVVLKNRGELNVQKDDLMDHLRPQFAKWWLPDDIVFMEEIPKSSVGKFLKRVLREQLADHLAVQ